MFKKIVYAVCLILLTGAAEAQNIQLHYDLGSALYDVCADRPKITTTVEMFKSDRWGSTFFFVDMDYRSEGITAAYWEIARELRFWEGAFSAHAEYNGGTPYIKNAWMLGATYSYNNKQFTRGFTITPMYKYIQKLSSPHQFQLTGTWRIYFAANKFSFTGFADWWREPEMYGDFVFLAEPQWWVNLNRFKGIDEHFNLSLGGEVELSYDFAGRNGFFAIPTLAAKWEF